MWAECVANISEGRDPLVIAALAEAGGDTLLDLHADPEHHRSVVTLGGPVEAVEDAARGVVRVAVARIDLRLYMSGSTPTGSSRRGPVRSGLHGPGHLRPGGRHGGHAGRP